MWLRPKCAGLPDRARRAKKSRRYIARTVTTLGPAAVALVVRLETLWVWLVTSLAPAGVRDRHRAERTSHLADHLNDDRANGHAPMRTAARILLRFLAGVPADIVSFVHESAVGIRGSKEAVVSAMRGYALFGIVIAAMIVGISLAMAIIAGPDHLLSSGYAQTIVSVGPGPNGPTPSVPNGPPPPGLNKPVPFAPPPCAAPPCAGLWVTNGPLPFGPGPVVASRLGANAWIAWFGLLLKFALMASLIILTWRLTSIVPGRRRPDDATRLLRERYARGEIDDDEFGRRLAVLR